jgi:hypothetical protein
VNITATISDATKVGNIYLRFVDRAASANNTIQDLVQVQVN